MVRPFAVIGFTVFFTISLLFEFETRVTVFALIAYTAALVISLLFKNARRNRVFPSAFASGVIACVLLLSSLNFLYYPSIAYDGKTCSLTAEITDNVEIEYGNYYYDARAVSVNGESSDIRLRLAFSNPPDIEPYDVVEGSFKFYMLGSSSQTMLQSHKAKGVFLGAYPMTNDFSVISIAEDDKPFAYKILDIRAKIKNAVYRVLPDERGALAVALILGDKSGLNYETLNNFNKIGISHIICVSGFHLSLWSMLILNILRKTKLNERLANALTIPFVILFMLIAGMTYSVIRAGIMMLVFLFGNIIMRRRDSLNSLGFALAFMGVINPFSMGSVALRLSVLSTLGIILYSQYIQPDINEKITKISIKVIGRFLRKAVDSFMITASATAFTLPISLGLYGGFNFAIFAANMVAVPVASISMVLCALGAAVGIFTKNIFALTGGLLNNFLIKFAAFIADIEILTFRLSSDKSSILLCGLFVICIVSILISYFGKKVKKLACVLCAVLFTFTVIFSSVIESGETKLRVIDCGNGTSVLLSCEGKNILIGCGGTEFLGSMYVCNAIDDSGGRIDIMIISDSSVYSSAYLNKVILHNRPEKIFYKELPQGSNLLLEDAEKYSFESLNLSENILVKSFYNRNNSCVHIKNKDISALVCFDAVLDFSSVPNEFKDADVIISRNDYPVGIEDSGCVLSVVNAENSRGIIIQNELEGLGINCAATGGCGDIIIRAEDGNISASRE